MSLPITSDWPLLARCVEMSAEAYASAPISSPDTHAACDVVHAGDHIAVAFRGSCSPEDFAADADFALHPLSTRGGMHVHAGFLRDWKSLVGQVLAALPKRGEPGALPVVLTGHSLGGALATLAAVDVQQVCDVRAVVTFGSPRTGDGAWVDFFDAQFGARSARVINVEDPIPLLPGLLVGYRHVTGERVLTAEGPLASGWEAMAIARVAALKRALTHPLDEFAEHHIAVYQHNVAAAEHQAFASAQPPPENKS